MTRCIVLLDGEHYPPVLRAALARAHEHDYEVVGAVFAGGYEKLTGNFDVGIPVVSAERPSGWHEQRGALELAISRFTPDVVLDISDAPVVDEQRRLQLAAVAVARGVGYRGADFLIEPPRRPRVVTAPSVAVIGSGKRVGKTAVGAHLARLIIADGLRPVVVAMGRGGPLQPQLVRGDEIRPDVRALLEVSALGGHAASDFYEDAVMAGVATVGACRAGAGLAGAPYDDTVAAAVEVANGLNPDVTILEGSGTAIPPVAADATVLVLRAGDIPHGFGIYRVLLADMVVVTMAEEPTASPRDLSALSSSLKTLVGDVVCVRTVFRPHPVEPVRGKTIFYATTAPETVSEKLIAHLENIHGARVAGISHRLGDRSGLQLDLEKATGSYEVLVTELKAAAVDTAARIARENGTPVVFADNALEAVDGDVDGALAKAVRSARERYAQFGQKESR
ncbi:MAG: 2,3-diphosphoglycerate synthetase [Actinomycetota bacterium]|nr:2,3-diphosphoglycerate synthetase [Actinomycetota bacterium]